MQHYCALERLNARITKTTSSEWYRYLCVDISYCIYTAEFLVFLCDIFGWMVNYLRDTHCVPSLFDFLTMSYVLEILFFWPFFAAFIEVIGIWFKAIRWPKERKKKSENYLYCFIWQFNFRGIISSCFEPHLTVYVELEEKTLMENLEKLVQVDLVYSPHNLHAPRRL